MQPLADLINAACADPTRLLSGCNPSDKNERRMLGSRLRQMMRNAKRFYIDEDVTRAATRLGVYHPNILMEMLHRARTPFPSVWLEWPLRVQLDEAGIDPADDAPERAGVLVERLDDIEPIFRMTGIGLEIGTRSRVMVQPLAAIYHLQTPIMDARSIPDHPAILEATQLPEEYISQSHLGSAYQHFADDDADELEIEQRRQYCEQLSSHVSYIFNPLVGSYIRNALAGRYTDEVVLRGKAVPHGDGLRRIMAEHIHEHSGEWRFVVALLALINAQDFVEREKPMRVGRSYIVAGHVVPYLEHVLVKLKLPRRIVEERMVRAMVEAIPRRRHEVMGHWRQSRKRGDPNCEHSYLDVTPTRQRCPLCNHSRWWVKEHERGDAAIGMVLKDRLVTRT